MTIVRHLLRITLPAIIVALAWQLVANVRPSYAFFLGSPAGIGREALNLFTQGTLVRDVLVTAGEALTGFVIGTLLGTLVGLTFWYSDAAYGVAKPYLIALGSLPIFALAPVLIFWFGTGVLSKIVMGVLSTFVVAVIQARNGAMSADRDLLRLAATYRASKTTTFWRIVVPSATLWVTAGIRLNVGMALLGAFIGELVASRAGLGYLIVVAQGLFNVNQIWVGVAGIILIAMLMQLLAYPAERWAQRWI